MSSCPDPANNSAGFTLVELMVGLAVFAILAVVGIPSMNSFISSNRLTSQANEFLSALQFARAEAVRLNRNILFCNTSDAQTCNVSTGKWDAWLILDPTTNSVLRTSLIANDSINVLSDNGISQDSIVFNSMGLVRNRVNIRQAQEGVIRVCIENASSPNYRDVRFRSGGQIEVVKPTTATGACVKPGSL